METQNIFEESSIPNGHDRALEVNAVTEATIKKVFEKTRNATNQALDIAEVKVVHGQELLKAISDRSIDLFRRYPVQSAATCLGAGYLFGKMLNSRKSMQ